MAEPPAEEVSPDPPPGSRVAVEDAIDGVTITVPPYGIWGATRWMFVFGLVWCSFLTLFTAPFLRGLFTGKLRGGACAACFVLPIFWVPGIVFLLGSINAGRRRTILSVAGDQLLVLLKGPFGSERRKWARAELRRIEAGPAPAEEYGVPVPVLHIRPIQGRTYHLLAGRDAVELRWLAARLRRALGLQ